MNFIDKLFKTKKNSNLFSYYLPSCRPNFTKRQAVKINNIINVERPAILDSNPKVCILFYGLTRSLIYTWPYIKKNILHPLDKANMSWHICVHTYDKTHINNPRSHEQELELNHIRDLQLLPPEKCSIQVTSEQEFINEIEFDDYTKCGDPWHKQDKHLSFQSLRNLLFQLNSLKKVTELAEVKKHQDRTYCFIRPDLAYIDPLPTDIIKTCIEYKNEARRYTPGWGKRNLHPDDVNDRFAVATQNAALMYGNRLDGAKKYAQINKLHSEEYVASICRTLNHKEFQTRALRVRANGGICERDIDGFGLNAKDIKFMKKKYRVPR